MGWMTGAIVVVAVDMWLGWRWLEVRASNRALTERLATNDWLLDYYRERDEQYRMHCENEAYLRATGYRDPERHCVDCGKETDEYYAEEDRCLAVDELQQAYGGTKPKYGCTCDEAFEAMYDLEPSCELHS